MKCSELLNISSSFQHPDAKWGKKAIKVYLNVLLYYSFTQHTAIWFSHGSTVEIGNHQHDFGQFLRPLGR